jgi:cytochrome P450
LEARDPETGQGMSETEVADNLLTLVTAGHETTALALTWSLFLLDRHEWAADRIAGEVAAVTGGSPVNDSHVPSLAFTRQVVQEAMRLYPPAAVVTREALRDMMIAGVPISAGTQVYVPIYALHRHARLWDRPDDFDPGRFDPAAVRLRHKFAYLPFGAGPHICIGMSFAMMEATAVLATLIRSLRFALRGGFQPDLVLRVTLRPGHGMPMRASPRG